MEKEWTRSLDTTFLHGAAALLLIAQPFLDRRSGLILEALLLRGEVDGRTAFRARDRVTRPRLWCRGFEPSAAALWTLECELDLGHEWDAA